MQPSTAAQLWGPSAAAASGDGGAAAAVQEEEEGRLLQPLKLNRVLESNNVQEPSTPCLLVDLPVELLHSICLSQAMCSPEGGVSLSLLSRTCTVFGKADKKGGTALVSQWTRQYCKEAGVCRLPLTMGDRWCWSRMLSWLSHSTTVRVGGHGATQGGHVTIAQGVNQAVCNQAESELSCQGRARCETGSTDGLTPFPLRGTANALWEGSVLLLVEPKEEEGGGAYH